MGKIFAISVLVVLFGITGADADIVELDLFDLGSQEIYDFDSPYWTTDFDLGVTFIEISNVYIDWSGQITAGLAVLDSKPDEPFPKDVGIGASLGSNPSLRYTIIWAGQATYPEWEPFDGQSEFEWAGSSSWSDLLDGKGTILIKYHEFIMLYGTYVEHGSATLDRATLIVEGVIPEPTTALLLGMGFILLRVSKGRMSRYIRT